MPVETWSLQFVREVGMWSLWLAPFVAAAGTFLTRSLRFPAAFAVGAAFDIATLMLLVRAAAEDQLEGGPLQAARRAGPMVAVRLGVKGLLLAGAAALPAFFDLWGMFAGVLMVDATLMTVGSVKAVSQTFR